MSNVGDCCAIIMAAGSGSRMTDVTNQCPKPFLPVGRFPMIWYPIHSLERAGFSDIVIITRKSWEKQMDALCNKCASISANIDIVGIPDSEDWGTADSLRAVADKVKTSALVMSCDLISDCDLSDLMSVHRKHKSSLTVMLSHLPTSIGAESLVPGFKPKQKNSSSEEKVSIGFENENAEHILFWRSQIDMDEDYLSLTKKFLDRFPCTRIQSKWTDCHVYMINHFVIKYLQDKSEMTSIQGELIPQVVKKQMSTLVRQPKCGEETDMSTNNSDTQSEKKKDLIDYAAEYDNDLTFQASFMSLTSTKFGVSVDSPQKDIIKCCAFRQTEGFCVRANTIATYFEACKQIPRLIAQFLPNKSKNVPESTSIKSKSQVGADCLLGEHVEIGEKVSVKKSVIGRNCKIEDKVKITNSVIMDNVTIQESSIISNCIIAESAKICNKCELTNCIVGQKQNISTMSKHANEALTAVTEMMEVPLE